MHIEKITLTNFKNYASQTFTFGERINAFVGLNGMGKTNLLDAIYYLCMCKSHFLASDSDVILRGADFLRVEGVIQKKKQREKIVAKVQARRKKVFERNDVPYSVLSDHIGFLPVVMIAPDDTELVKEGSEGRRRFLDNTLSQLDNNYLTNLIYYNRILEQRNSLLKKSLDEGVNKELDNLLTIYDSQLLPSAAYIFKKRKQFIQDFEPVFNEIYQKIADLRETVMIEYESQLNSENRDKDLWTNSREKDKILQRTTIGIHRDDLVFGMGDKSVKKFGSQGQLKCFVIALKLAQYEILRGVKTESPILLLDDIFDKLDENRVRNLLQLILNQSFGQIFITDTHEVRMNAILESSDTDFKVFFIDNGVSVESNHKTKEE